MLLDLCLISLPNPVLANPTMYFPLGILYIAAVVKEAGYNVGIVDMRDGLKDVPDAHFYGFSCTTPEVTYARSLMRQLDGKTIIGGAHPSLAPDDCKDFDYVVVGEGEVAILAVLGGIKTQLVMSPSRLQELDNIPYPAWDMVERPFSEELFPGERYGKGELGATLIASRGCNFNCSFCGNVYRKPTVFRSIENIIGELKELQKRGVYYFRFEDDNFTTHPQFADLCLKLNGLGIKYKCHTRSRLLTLGKARLLKWSGCEEMSVGVESGDQDVLDINHKQESVEHHLQAVSNIREARMRAKTYLIAGLPGETGASVERTKDFIRQSKPDKWTLSTFTPYPGCDVYRRPKEYGVEILDWDYSKWWNFCEDSFVHRLEGQTQEEMWQRYLELYEWLKNETWK